ncbi:MULTISPECIES: glycosyltransferase family 4 protein [Pseudomonas]|uniref:glycosyltransferase family 4 protein n=1 Tax=Pseudomonas TaxID=286 RepID=UPI000B35F3F3|nr:MULTISPECIES: glycosyltransferase family 4 protein [Pseudomonas]PMY59670.1 colanic acid biosynthesis glycosyltransferase WcaI [Pseudomonas sp. FW305-25]PMY60967.1 colanic acid biosynthesis glycosyltransferase WcaI [Pseudomonas sp. FW126-L8]PNA69936.1 colanic acid biosynthesis glycosyltransferase WcaI [Pseudomonas sp. FW305-76]
MTESKLRILVVTQYFWPENMRINDLVRDFSEKGHEVTVLTGWPNYPEGKVFSEYKTNPEGFKSYFGARIVRVPLVSRGKRSISLILNYLSFFISASTLGAVTLRKKKFDAVFVYAVSPIMAAIPAVLIGCMKRVPVYIWILDLWPETLRAVGVLRHPTMLAMVGRVVSWIYNRADYLLLQSKGFSNNVKQYCTKEISPERLVYFPSWAEDDFSDSPVKSSNLLERDDTTFTVVFAGNLGDAQDLPAVLDAAESLKDSASVRWVIVGDGRMSKWLGEQVELRGLKNVLLLGRHPLSAMPEIFACADALLVSLKTNDVFEKTVPGKVQAYLASSKPVLGMINGEAARIIEESGCGFSCPSGDAQGLAQITLRLATTDSAQRETMGQAGRSYYLSHFSKVTLLERLEVLFRAGTLRKDIK